MAPVPELAELAFWNTSETLVSRTLKIWALVELLAMPVPFTMKDWSTPMV